MLKNGIYNLAGTLARLCLSLLSVPLLLQFLGASTYGLYSILLAIVNLAVLSEWSICMVLAVFIPHNDQTSATSEENVNDTLRQALILVLGLASFTSLALWGMAPFLSLFFSNLNIQEQQMLKQGCQVASIVVLLRLLQQYFIGIEQAHGQYKILNSINTLFSVCQTSIILIVAYYYRDIVLLILVQAGVTIVFLNIHWYYCYKNKWLTGFKLVGKMQWNSFRSMLLYGGRTFLGGIGSAFFSQGDRIVVGRLLGLEASGFYSALTGIATQIHTLSTMAVQPLVPALSGIINQRELTDNKYSTYDERIKNTIGRSLVLNATLAVGIGSIIIVFAPEVSLLLLKEKLSTSFASVKSLRIIVSIYTLYSFNAVGYYILYAVKREIVNTLTTFFCGPFSLFMIGVLAHLYGLIGALLGNAGYLLTLFLLVEGFKSFQLQGKMWLSKVWLPLLVLTIIILGTLFLSSLASRIAFVTLMMCILCLPLAKEGWIYLSAKKNSIS